MSNWVAIQSDLSVSLIKDFSKVHWKNRKFILSQEGIGEAFLDAHANIQEKNKPASFDDYLFGDDLFDDYSFDYSSSSEESCSYDYDAPWKYRNTPSYMLFTDDGRWATESIYSEDSIDFVDAHVFDITPISTIKTRLVPGLPLPDDVKRHINTFLSGSKTVHFFPYIYSAKYREREKIIDLEESTRRISTPTNGRMHQAVRNAELYLTDILLQREHPMETIQKVLDAYLSKRAWPTPKQSWSV